MVKKWINAIVYSILKVLPNNMLLRIENRTNGDKKGYIQRIRLNQFAKHIDSNELRADNQPVCTIDRGAWDYPLFQISFLINMIALCIDCLSKGYRPYIAYVNKNDINLWEEFLEQPFPTTVDQKIVKCTENDAGFKIPNFPSPTDVALFYKVYTKLLRFNAKTKEYFDAEYNNLIKNKGKVLGVLCRGTDYTANRPKNHPVQPEIDEVIELCKIKMQELNFEKIYLATEEEAILNRFIEEFTIERIITNKRNYFDSFYSIRDRIGNESRISQVRFERENDDYLKSLEYMSSLNLLSKCDGLIAGSTGGSRFALVMNNNQYEYAHLFNKGFY